MPRILIRGANEFGSAFAHRLWQSGASVVLHDDPRPADCHRWMAFTDAAYDDRATLDGVTALRLDSPVDVGPLLSTREALPLLVIAFDAVLAALQPAVLIDARMRKRIRPEHQRGLAPLTVGLGPGFRAGENVDLAFETGFGADFGQVYLEGATRDLAGEPPAVSGVGRERFIYAPREGTFRTAFEIGMSVVQGELIAAIDGHEIRAAVAGALRGLTHDGAPVIAGMRVVEIDPRGFAAVTRGLGLRQTRLVEACLPMLGPQLSDAIGG